MNNLTPSQERLDETSSFYANHLKPDLKAQQKASYGLKLEQVAETLGLVFGVDPSYVKDMYHERGYDKTIAHLEKRTQNPSETNSGLFLEEDELSLYDTDFDLEDCATRLDVVGSSLGDCVKELDAKRVLVQ